VKLAYAPVTIGLDVHASSVRLAAVHANELLDERTLPYEHEAVARALRRWPSVHCCYEAGPTGFGLYRYRRLPTKSGGVSAGARSARSASPSHRGSTRPRPVLLNYRPLQQPRSRQPGAAAHKLRAISNFGG
jgi:hypothetical protein